jgi:23S rRNA C2498 (ribose-2'-O)-methylase RlmM
MTQILDQSLKPTWWLARIPEVFVEFADAIAPSSVAKDGEGDYRRIAAAGMNFPLATEHLMFTRWHMPVHHAWPCNPEKTAGFIEKAATAIAEKFASHHPKALIIGAFDPHTRNGYFRKLASNLRGRALQLIPAASTEVDLLDADDPVIHVMVGSTGLFCGLQTPRQANGFHAGGTRFVRQSGDDVLSRAGAKIVEALHHMRLFGMTPEKDARWLELGACPGGMTSELLRHGYRVTAIDRAPLDPALARAHGLEFFLADVARWKPATGRKFDALLCDMNGLAHEAFAQVVRLSSHLVPGAPIVFTLKTSGAEGVGEIIQLEHRIVSAAIAAGIRHLQTTHLTYNRREFTMFLRKTS